MKAVSYIGYFNQFRKPSLVHDPGHSYLWTTVLFNISLQARKKKKSQTLKYKHFSESHLQYI